MALTLDPALEQRIQQELAASQFRDASDLLNHALDLVTTERTADDWLLRNKDAINQDLDESFAAKERGEFYSPEEARALLQARREARKNQAA